MLRLVVTKCLLTMAVVVGATGSPVHHSTSTFVGITCQGFTADGATTGQFTGCSGNTGGYSKPFPMTETQINGGPIIWANGLRTRLVTTP